MPAAGLPFMACSACLALLPRATYLPGDGTAHSGLDPLTDSNLENAIQTYADQYDGGNASVEVPFPQVTRVCSKLTKINQHTPSLPMVPFDCKITQLFEYIIDIIQRDTKEK